MKVTFLGTGTSQGIPVIACTCEVCSSVDARDNRLRCSVLLEYEGHSVVIDTGPDFRQQMLREKVTKLDAVVYTHEHKDHVAGLDDIRAFNFFQSRSMDLYLSKYVEYALKREFAYIFEDEKYPGIPRIDLHIISNSPFNILGKEFIPIEVLHFKLPVFGYRIGDFCYVTDAKSIEKNELDKMRGARVIVLNALRRESHISHFTLAEAVEVLTELNPERAYITHLSHQMGLHDDVEKTLPDFIRIAYDGLTLEI